EANNVNIVIDNGSSNTPLDRMSEEELENLGEISDPYFTNPDDGLVYGFVDGGSCPGFVDVCNSTPTVNAFADAIDAINNVADGATPITLNVMAGTYGVAGTVPLTRSNVTISGAGAGSSIIDGGNAGGVNGRGIALGNVSNVIIEGFTFQNLGNGGLLSERGQGVYADGSAGPANNITVRNNTFSNVNWAAVFAWSNGSTVHNNWVIDNNTVTGTDLYALECSGCANSQITNNTITGSPEVGVLLFPQGGNTGNNTVSGNNISGATNSGITSLSFGANVNGNTFSNNTINVPSGGSAISVWEGGGTINNTNISGNTVNATNATGGWNFGGQIQVQDSENNTISNNTVNVNGVGGAGEAISVNNAGGNNTISGNNVNVSGPTPGPSDYTGVNITGTANGGITISGNAIDGGNASGNGCAINFNGLTLTVPFGGNAITGYAAGNELCNDAAVNFAAPPAPPATGGGTTGTTTDAPAPTFFGVELPAELPALGATTRRVARPGETEADALIVLAPNGALVTVDAILRTLLIPESAWSGNQIVTPNYDFVGINPNFARDTDAQARLTRADAGSIPALPQGVNFLSGWTVDVLLDGEPVIQFADGTRLHVSFSLLDEWLDRELQILFWNEDTGEWEEVSTRAFEVPNLSTPGLDGLISRNNSQAERELFGSSVNLFSWGVWDRADEAPQSRLWGQTTQAGLYVLVEVASE
ncbi:MAG: nitrous oxide reductase family maturation protein NosD, partial [Anaerolineales bacterium]